MDNQEIINQHLVRIVDLLGEVLAQVKGMDYQTFESNEQVKDTVYENLQEIGQAADELTRHNTFPEDLEVIANLKNFNGATYNQVTETNHQMVFGVIQNDFEEIIDIITEHELYQNRLS
ncbi:hypothetical protein KIH41_15510 [Litoribacter ruber]|uniref:DUF86 domain-containing protein n=1 Tax=Litoribacter ruber TaxID=702568 RepID=A0AAP2G4M7_9BACT|nr:MULTISPECIES: hypothetical protein [Litoribacter]MBS9524675.1 hypothetical protein [Litoribacter alkaliphilus]MBT0812695.1 hypothetical protein [Litoribacter ruber]